ncbi:mucoidy inhibitor MuiA family protein [Jannaschia donghaensis]|uniref:DUF4139 domain-containing protein n=1 Tax=Jannaschia donghaensis TaxID=420998 RepID=A0A0M6YGP3_9RHOB|nr:mucoidy inhibitor MuiA family protein [Jannaschia donghaensis]CTQ48949.1 hypothetical protein JDO7802_00957 [Jannaschia donghaensis]
MRHTLFLTTFLTLPGIATAADFPLTAPVTEAEIYLQGAMLLRTGAVDLPAGDHRLLVPHSDGARLPDIALTGATLGAVEVLPDAVADGRAYLTDPQQTALDAYEAALEAEQLAQDARLRAEAAVTAAQTQLAFLQSIDAAGLDALNAEAMLATLDVIETRVALAEIARADARAALRAAERAVRDAGFDRAQAKLDLDATGATLGSVSLLAIGVSVAQAGPVGVAIEAFSQQAGWATKYDVALDADEGVTLDRKVEVWQRSGLPLTEIAVTLSTADPFAQTEPAFVPPDQARLREEAVESVATSSLQRAAPAPAQFEAMADAGPEPIVAQANFDGPVVTYDYPRPVTLPINGSLTLALDTLTLDARVFNRAAPRTDETAFLMAEVTNSTGEPLLPGIATIYREGARIGDTPLPLMPAGDEVELAFGPQQHLRLEFAALDNATGDRGLFFTSGTRTQDMVFRIRNLSDEAEVIETRFALPYSEEEDLEVRVTTDPAPDTRDVEDRRGVAEWVLDVAPGSETEVEIGVTLEWPEGETLIWQP